MITKSDITKLFNIWGDITINDINGSPIVDVEGSVEPYTQSFHIEKLPFKFGKVESFIFNDVGLTTLIGSPQDVTSTFNVVNNKLSTLEGGPKTVGTYYFCNDNPLMNLKGAPDTVGAEFQVSWQPELPLLSIVKYNDVYVFNNRRISNIIRKYCKNARGDKPLRQAIIQCQKELLDAGFKGNATL